VHIGVAWCRIVYGACEARTDSQSYALARFARIGFVRFFALLMSKVIGPGSVAILAVNVKFL
jgi:hypothetical protein